jgi:hypothetical protein
MLRPKGLRWERLNFFECVSGNSPSMTSESTKPFRRKHWPEIVILILSVPLLLFLTGVFWVGLHWLPLATAAAVTFVYLLVGLFVLALIWFVMRVIAAK